jgi:macrolide-specific efflux system membrane fusion protein
MRRSLWVGVALLVVVAVIGWWLWRPAAETATFRDETVVRGDIEVTVQATGVVQPRNRLEVKPPLPGRMDTVLVQEGERVKRGQILAWMSSTERAALIDAARARGPEETARWEELYRPTPIISPIDGTLIKRAIEPGQSFTGNDAVLVVADHLIVDAQVDETDIAQIKLRQPARIVLDAYPNEPVAATVTAVAYEAKTVNNVTTYVVDVAPARVPPVMRSGMTAGVHFRIASRKAVLVLPAQAVRRQDGQETVQKKGAEGAAQEQIVKTGLSDGRQVEIIEGLNEGDVVRVPQFKAGNRPSGGSPLSPGGARPANPR